MNNEGIILDFIYGRTSFGNKPLRCERVGASGTMYLYSYGKVIAIREVETVNDGDRVWSDTIFVISNKSQKLGGYSYSKTTSKHINLLFEKLTSKTNIGMASVGIKEGWADDDGVVTMLSYAELGQRKSDVMARFARSSYDFVWIHDKRLRSEKDVLYFGRHPLVHKYRTTLRQPCRFVADCSKCKFRYRCLVDKMYYDAVFVLQEKTLRLFGWSAIAHKILDPCVAAID